MSDYLVRWARQPVLRTLLKRTGLPVPPTLARGTGRYPAQPLDGKKLRLGASSEGGVSAAVQTALRQAGAEIEPTDQPAPAADARYDGLVFDATGMGDAAELRGLYEFFHQVIHRLAANARVVILARPPEAAESVAAGVAARAVEGFMRSLAKEIGRKGATANLLYVEIGAEDRLAGPLRFFLSDRATFVDGQPLRVTSAGSMPPTGDFTQPLAGKVALVTGGARGIGAATAARLAEEGARVVVLDVPADRDTLESTAKAIGGTALPQDITDADAPRRIADFLISEFGGVDVMVHNAGITRDKMLANMRDDHWDLVLAINLRAILAIDEVLLGEAVIRDHGRVLCLSSVGGVAGNAGQTNYATTKAGLIGYVQARGKQSTYRGLTFNAVAPGFIETRMTAAMPFLPREGGRRLSSLSQGGLPRDVAETLTFLATPGAGGINGNVLRVCGQSLIGA